ncbi:MAG: SusC/RagA family TonB-linked outer membrane protein, partial [Bacteroidetes bacterium]|nr:SusC/RagA family TonB-linked outer membrane protein [Bacteroidota bacterium]
GQIFVPIFNGILPDGTWDVSTDETEFEVVGNGLPNFTFNMANSFSYKNWDLNFLLRGVFGHSLVNALRVFYEQPNVAPTYNVLASSNRPELSGLTTNEARLSSFHVEKADFLTLDNLTLGHNIAGLSESTAFKSLRFYVSVQNLFILTKYEGVDPEVRFADPGQVGNGDFQIVPFSDPLAPGIDRRNTWFTTRTFTVGFNVGF